MSCQQVPRLTEDPYIFTEPPVTTTIYHSQFGKLTPVRTKSQKLSQQKKLPQLQQPQQQQRLNGGLIHLVNGGVHSNNKNLNNINSLKTITTTIDKSATSLTSQIITAGTTTATTVLSTNASDISVGAASAVTTTGTTTIFTKSSPKHNKRILLTPSSPTIATVLPQQTQQHNQNNNININSNNINNNNNSNNIQQTHTYHIPPLLPPPPLYHQTNYGQQQHSRTSVDTILGLSPNNHSISTSAAISAATTVTTTSPSVILLNQKNQLVQQQKQYSQQSQLHQHNTFHTTSATTANLNNCQNIESVHQQLYQCPTSTTTTSDILYPINIKTENLLIDDDNNLLDEYKNVNKLISNNNINNSNSNNQFATIIPKSETPSSLTAFKTLGKLSRTKNRSYSQTSHHEVLQRISSRGSTNSNSTTASTEWHAPDTYVFDYLGPGATHPEDLELAADYQKTWWMYDDTKNTSNIINNTTSIINYNIYNNNNTNNNNLSREERLTIKAANLRRQATQYKNAFSLRSKLSAKKRLICVSNAINKFKITDDDEIQPPQKCCVATCSNDSLALTAYCYIHITQNTDQRLFHPCTAKFSDNTQCRVPVFDISHELPLCREHAWKRDNYNRILQEQKPKKPPRKKSKPSAMTRPPKRNKKKKKPQQLPSKQETLNMLNEHTQVDHHMQEQEQDEDQQQHHDEQHYHLKEEEFLIQQNEILLTDEEQQQHNHHNQLSHQQLLQHQQEQQTMNIHTNNNFNHNMLNHHHHNNLNNLNLNNHHHNHNILKQHSTTPAEILSNMSLPQHEFTIDDVVIPHLTTQEFINVCENSSAYESSEDTGVGGLSESEMIGAHDVIEEMPLSDTRLLEEHDLTNVLNQLPEDAFNELFTVQQNGPFEPTQEEQEDLERALEAVDEQVKSLEQMTGSSNFLGDFLDVVDDQMLDESELVVCSDVLQGSNNTEIRGLVHT